MISVCLGRQLGGWASGLILCPRPAMGRQLHFREVWRRVRCTSNSGRIAESGRINVEGHLRNRPAWRNIQRTPALCRQSDFSLPLKFPHPPGSQCARCWTGQAPSHARGSIIEVNLAIHAPLCRRFHDRSAEPASLGRRYVWPLALSPAHREGVPDNLPRDIYATDIV